MDSEITEKAICKTCHAEFERRVLILFGARHFVGENCDACVTKENNARKAEIDAENAAERETEWVGICPLIYRDTNPNDSRLAKEAVSAVSGWQWQTGRGLGLLGTTGRGKTRCLYLALRKVFVAGKSVAAVSHTKFSRLAMDAYSGTDEERYAAREKLRSFHTCRVLLIDDLGKPPSTERADSELEEIVEDRTSEEKPILWSANGSGEWLIKRFGIDRGEPTVRRLAEFCDVITLK